MGKQNKTKSTGQKSDEMNALDQGPNLIFQAINRATGLDKSNDGKKGNKKE